MDTDPGPEALVLAWMNAIARADIRAAVEDVYQQAGREIAERGPACWASGRCCNFDAAGHRLYVTGLETAYLIAGLTEAPRNAPAPAPLPIGGLSLPQIDLAGARARSGCPFQERNLCGVHTIKPLGCRVYFCDRTAQAWQNDLSERLLSMLRAVHEQHGIAYRYGEWRAMLAMFTTAG